MIFQKEHIEQIKNEIKTQTRRVNRGKYKIGKDYAVQPCRTCKGIKDMRIVIDKIYLEKCWGSKYKDGAFVGDRQILISKENAKAEGNYTPEEFEKKFRELNPKWLGLTRWVFVFHLIRILGDDTVVMEI